MNIQLMENGNGFEVIHDGQQVGKIIWQVEGAVMKMTGTVIDPSLRGQSIGEKLLDAAVLYAKEHQYKMLAICPYVVKMFARDEKYKDIIA